jgi:predicted metal-dependent phosphoesterase TrpH
MFVSEEEAARHGLDFLAITDHNTTSHYDEERELQPYFDKLLLIPDAR